MYCMLVASIFGPVHPVVGSKLEYASGPEDLHCFKLKKQIWEQFQMNLVCIDILSPSLEGRHQIVKCTGMLP
nr:hypothetical protein CFP56_24690 [Quercus suber]